MVWCMLFAATGGAVARDEAGSSPQEKMLGNKSIRTLGTYVFCQKSAVLHRSVCGAAKNMSGYSGKLSSDGLFFGVNYAILLSGYRLGRVVPALMARGFDRRDV